MNISLYTTKSTRCMSTIFLLAIILFTISCTGGWATIAAAADSGGEYQQRDRHGPLSASKFRPASSVVQPSLASSSSSPKLVNPTYPEHFSHPRTERVHAYRRRRWDVAPKHIQHNGMKIQVIQAPLTGCPSLDFNVECSIGGQSFECELDSGSTTLGVAAAECASSGQCGGLTNSRVYQPGVSATSWSGDTADDAGSTFGDNSGWSGSIYSDMVSVGDSEAVSIKFVAINSQDQFFLPAICPVGAEGVSGDQAILGFAGNQLAVSGVSSHVTTQQWFEVYQNHTGIPNLFTIRMCQGTGDLWLGGYDSHSFIDRIHWTNIAVAAGYEAGEGFYAIQLKSIGAVGGQAYTNFRSSAVSIVDSGTTEALIPAGAYTLITNAIDAADFHTFFRMTYTQFVNSGNCYPSSSPIADFYSELPPVVFRVGAASGNDVFITLNGVNFYLQLMEYNGDNYFCPSIAPSTENFFILGWSFMNQLVVVHDLDAKQIGFAARTASGCVDGNRGAVAVTGGDVRTDATGSDGKSTFNSSTNSNFTTPQPTSTQESTSSSLSSSFSFSTSTPVTTELTETTSATSTTIEPVSDSTTTSPITSTLLPLNTTTSGMSPTTITTTSQLSDSTTAETTTASTVATSTTTVSTTPTERSSSSSAQVTSTPIITTTTIPVIMNVTTSSSSTTTTTGTVVSSDSTSTLPTATTSLETTTEIQQTTTATLSTSTVTTTATTTTTSSTTSTSSSSSSTTSSSPEPSTSTPSTWSSDCDSYECSNSGSCWTNWFHLAECNCTAGFFGSHCEYMSHDPNNKTAPESCEICQNGGVPINSACNLCQCPAGFTDFDCSLAFARIVFVINFNVNANATNTGHHVTTGNQQSDGVSALITVLQSYLGFSSEYQLQLESYSSDNTSVHLTVDILCDGCSQHDIQAAAQQAVKVNASMSRLAAMNSMIISITAQQIANAPNGCLYTTNSTICPTSEAASQADVWATNSVLTAIVVVSVIVCVIILAGSAYLCSKRGHGHAAQKVPLDEPPSPSTTQRSIAPAPSKVKRKLQAKYLPQTHVVIDADEETEMVDVELNENTKWGDSDANDDADAVVEFQAEDSMISRNDRSSSIMSVDLNR